MTELEAFPYDDIVYVDVRDVSDDAEKVNSTMRCESKGFCILISTNDATLGSRLKIPVECNAVCIQNGSEFEIVMRETTVSADGDYGTWVVTFVKKASALNLLVGDEETTTIRTYSLPNDDDWDAEAHEEIVAEFLEGGGEGDDEENYAEDYDEYINEELQAQFEHGNVENSERFKIVANVPKITERDDWRYVMVFPEEEERKKNKKMKRTTKM